MTQHVKIGPTLLEPSPASWEQLQQNYILGRAAVEELALLKPILALAISKLPKQQLKVSLTDQSNLGDLDLQMKQESSGALVFRSVKV